MSRDRVIAWAASISIEASSSRISPDGGHPDRKSEPRARAELAAYLEDEIAPALTALGTPVAAWRIRRRLACRFCSPSAARGPADRPCSPTARRRGRGMEEDWRDGLDPGGSRGRGSAGMAGGRRTTRAAFHQHRGPGRRAGRQGLARLHLQDPDRDRRGDGLPRPSRRGAPTRRLPRADVLIGSDGRGF